MAAKPLTTEAIALTEKKMDMTLDDIIKMSKSNTVKDKKPRTSNKSQKFMNAAQEKEKSSKMRQFLDSRSSLRQGFLAKRRSNFQVNQFPMATEVARKAAVAPIQNRAFNRNRVVNWNKPRIVGPIRRNVANGAFPVKHQQQPQQQQVKSAPKQRPQTLDSLFADMKEQRMRISSRQNNNNVNRRNGFGQQRLQRGRGRFGN